MYTDKFEGGVCFSMPFNSVLGVFDNISAHISNCIYDYNIVNGNVVMNGNSISSFLITGTLLSFNNKDIHLGAVEHS